MIALGKKKYRGLPLWSFVGELTGHGSGYSRDICMANGWNPVQSADKSL